MPLRVFPRKTHATPTDGMAYVGYPGLFAPKAEEIHVSVTFTWDLPLAERLARAWEPYGPVSIGGPAIGSPGGSFTPGLYLRRGYVITSAGAPTVVGSARSPRAKAMSGNSRSRRGGLSRTTTSSPVPSPTSGPCSPC